MKNSLNDLHNHLFEQLERLNDDDKDLTKVGVNIAKLIDNTNKKKNVNKS